MENQAFYDQMLNELENRRATLVVELEKIERLITAFKATHNTPPIFPPSTIREVNPYAAMSVRWAVLKLLFEYAVRPLKTAEISDALMDGGNNYATKTNVSAVVSDMLNKRGELKIEDDGYVLTDTGKTTWQSITHSARYRQREASISTNV